MNVATTAIRHAVIAPNANRPNSAAPENIAAPAVAFRRLPSSSAFASSISLRIRVVV
jgi:hypothetical protein